MLKKFQKTLSIGLSGLLVLGIGVANAADAPVKRANNVLHEMVPHVVLPETIQYNKTAKNLPGMGYTGVNSPYVATYVAYPSYQVPYTATFRPVGQSVYPVSPNLLPAPLPEEQLEPDSAAAEVALQEVEGRDVVLNNTVAEPIRLASGAEEVIPALPMPHSTVMQTGVFCQHPAKPPSAWAFSSPLFKVASVPAGWGSQSGSITHNSPKGSGQHIGFQPGSVDPADGATMPQGIPASTFQMGRMSEEGAGAQAQVLPNGMILLTLPQDHRHCGLIRCRTGNAPRTMLLPPAGGFGMPQTPQTMMPMPGMQSAMMSGGLGIPFMPVSQQPQMQVVPVTAMTPMGPAVVGFQQIPMMSPMMNPMDMMSPMLQQPQQIQMAMASPNPMVAAQAAAEGDNVDASGAVAATANPMGLVATPYGFAIQVPADALQGDAATQLAQMQQTLMQQMPVQMPTNPYAGLYVTPFGYMALNQSAGQLGGLGQNMMMNVGHQPMGMTMPGQGGMSVSDMLQIMTFINSNKPQRRARMFERIAERREARRANCDNDPMTQLMQAWTTPYVSPDTALRMPSRNAYPYGYFGIQASPMSTANYGGYHNLYMGSTAYPGLY
jgi:hypothetical protein